MASTVKLEPPLEMDFNGNPGLRRFETLEEAEAFIEEDAKAWQPIYAAAEQRAREGQPAWNSFVNAHRTHLSTMQDQVRKVRQTSAAASSTNSAPVQAALSFYQNKACLHSQSALGRMAIGLLRAQPDTAISILVAATFPQPILLQTNQFGLISAIPLIRGGTLTAVSAVIEQGLISGLIDTDRLSAAIRTAELAMNDAQAKRSEFAEASGTAVAEFKSKTDAELSTLAAMKANFEKLSGEQIAAEKQTHDAQHAEHETRMKAIETAFKEQMKLRAPRQYWSDKCIEHKKASRFWMSLFWIGSAIGVAAFAGIGWLTLSEIAQAEKNLAASWVIIVVPTLIILSVLRFFHKQATTHLVLQQDAQERVTMLETYLALFEEQKIQEVERPLVLQPLFRPSGAVGDEGIQRSLAEHLIDMIAKK
jgi:hypothetical protein